MKYIILDEITLDVVTDNDGSESKKVFNTQEEARKYAIEESSINAWQVVGIAWSDEDLT